MARPPSTTIEDLVGRIISVEANTSAHRYPRFGLTLEQAWTQLQRSIENMRTKLGQARSNQLLEMLEQAKQHFLDSYQLSPTSDPVNGTPGAEDSRLGTRLMQDIEWIARGREPFAYPKDLYRWPRLPGLRAAGDPDLEKDFPDDE